MTMTSYVGLLRKDATSDYGVEFPDFPGCVTAGRDLDEARRMAVEALALHIEGLTEDRAMIPEPSSLDAIMADPDNRDAVVVLVDAPTASRVIRVNITMEEAVLAMIDRATSNRSRFLADAAREKLQRDRIAT